ncbi:hypothetical protein CkaCkLH20_08364 [Colletotrichum karsti]|uniref:Uncharacterized protein n=1 Tax=Colletotrichum karsti TaxID=1095194 RepID=A0A9P6LIV1_9PEZI|nr:uncharacterized protein CkaCkLH20_08364 [Colletotrichum karsti]KAF9873992.1 hypothetical protein CkaCkLH20_08364 [Colletotrichum karsti]
MNSRYIDHVTNKSVLENLPGSPPTLKEALDESTSSWGRDQLRACRVIVTKSEETLLPAIRENQEAFQNTRKISADMPSCGDALAGFYSDYPAALRNLTSLIHREIPGTLESEHAYVRQDIVNGRFWSLLDRFRVTSPKTLTYAAAPVEESPGGLGSSPPIMGLNEPAPFSHVASSPSIGPHASLVIPGLNDNDDNGVNNVNNNAFDADDNPGPQHLPHTPRPQRWTTILNPPCYVPSSHPSSEPPVMTSPHSDFVPPREFSAVASATEDLTVSLISEFIRQTLLWAPPQHGARCPDPVVDFDVQRRNLTTHLPGSNVSFGCFDDGGLYVHQFGHLGVGRTPLEAKRALGTVVEGKPKFDDSWLGQVVGELLAARFCPGDNRSTVFIIVAAQTYLRFFSASTTPEYIDQIVANAADSSSPFDECLRIAGTCWFNLQDKHDRVHALRNLSGIVTLTKEWIK